MKWLTCVEIVAAASVVALPAAAAEVWNDTGAFYISGMVQYTFLDDKRISKDGLGEQAGLGYNFAPNFALEVDYNIAGFKVKGDRGNVGASEQLQATSLDVVYKFLPNSLFRPYVLLGAGELQDTIAATPVYRSWMAETGAGVLTGLGSQSGSVRFQLRTEAKYRREFIQNTPLIPHDPGDVVLGVGLQVSFGNPTPPLPTVAAPPPAPEPAPIPREVVVAPPPEPCHAPAGFQVDANCHIIEQTVVVRAIDFEFNSVHLTGPAQRTLDEVSAALLTQPELNVEVQGHTDSVGSDAYNLGLSQRRADAVKAYLVSKGLNASVLTAKGYGKSHPVAGNDTAEGRAQNRRVAFEVTNGFAHVIVLKKDASEASTEAAEQGEPEKIKK